MLCPAWPPRAARPIPQPSAPGRNLSLPTALPSLPNTRTRNQPSPRDSCPPDEISVPLRPSLTRKRPTPSSPRPASPRRPVTSYTHNNGDNPTRLPRRPSYLEEKYLTYGKWTSGGGPFRRIRKINHVHHSGGDTEPPPESRRSHSRPQLITYTGNHVHTYIRTQGGRRVGVVSRS